MCRGAASSRACLSLCLRVCVDVCLADMRFMIGGVLPILLLTSLGHVFFLGTFASEFSLSKDRISCDLKGRNNDGVGFFSILGWANTALFETDPQCLDCRFGFCSLIIQGIRKQYPNGRVLQFG